MAKINADMPGLDLKVSDMEYNWARRQFAKDLSNAGMCASVTIFMLYYIFIIAVCRIPLFFLLFYRSGEAVTDRLSAKHGVRQLMVGTERNTVFGGQEAPGLQPPDREPGRGRLHNTGGAPRLSQKHPGTEKSLVFCPQFFPYSSTHIFCAFFRAWCIQW